MFQWEILVESSNLLNKLQEIQKLLFIQSGSKQSSYNGQLYFFSMSQRNDNGAGDTNEKIRLDPIFSNQVEASNPNEG